MVLTYELLFGKGLKGGGQLKRAMMRHKDELERAVKDTRAVATVQHRSESKLEQYVNDRPNFVVGIRFHFLLGVGSLNVVLQFTFSSTQMCVVHSYCACSYSRWRW